MPATPSQLISRATVHRKHPRKDTEDYLLELLCAQAFTARELARLLDVSEQYIRKLLKELVSEGHVVRVEYKSRVYYALRRCYERA